LPQAAPAPRPFPRTARSSGKIAPVDPTAPNILFQVGLPESWNQKVVMFGGGGFDGTIPEREVQRAQRARRQAHAAGPGLRHLRQRLGPPGQCTGFAGRPFGLNDEAVRNFGGDVLKKTRDTALAIIKARYAASPVKSYFAGGSTGGREALAAIQRWPADWDGAIAWYPAWNDAAALLGGHRMSRALAQPGAYPNAAKRLVLYEAAMETCDALDGVVDGLISNQTLCNARFDPSTPPCGAFSGSLPGRRRHGQHLPVGCADRCDEHHQHGDELRFPLASGETQYPGYNIWGADTGITSWTSPLEPTVTFLAFGASQPARPMPANAPYVSVLTDQWIKYFIDARPGLRLAVARSGEPGPWANRISALSTQLDTSTDISAFKARGGKLLLAHGLADVLVSTRATEQYYLRLQSSMGPSQVDAFVRYYEVAGLGHAVSSVFNATWDSLTALDQWSVDGTAPAGQVTTDTAGVPGRTRPLCDYPKWPQYKGSGDVNVAASFRCAD
jgi:hypothetical protein